MRAVGQAASANGEQLRQACGGCVEGGAPHPPSIPAGWDNYKGVTSASAGEERAEGQDGGHVLAGLGEQADPADRRRSLVVGGDRLVGVASVGVEEQA